VGPTAGLDTVEKTESFCPFRKPKHSSSSSSMWSSVNSDWAVPPADKNIRLNTSERHIWAVSSYGRLNRGLVQYLLSEPGCPNIRYVTLHLHFICSPYTVFSLFYLRRKLHACYSAAAVKSEINGILWWNVKFYVVSTTWVLVLTHSLSLPWPASHCSLCRKKWNNFLVH
jgi:hypothetical protein